jgi:hypothetical protein
MKRLLAVAVSLAFAAGCSGETPTEMEGLTPEFGVAGNSGCYTVKFDVRLEWVGPGLPLAQYITGDLVGTAEADFSSGAVKFAGATYRNGGTYHWNITDGIIPGLERFETQFDNKNFLTDRPGSPYLLFENIGTHRALSGVERANLTYKGYFDARILQGHHHYQGVICP